MAVRLCACSCHGSITTPYPLVGFDPTIDADVIEAAVSCSQCRPLHVRIFEKPTVVYKLPLLLPETFSTDGDQSEGAES
jgi:hypothetical protein